MKENLDMSVSVIIPTFNEAGSIAEVVEAIPAVIDTQVLVVDGGSSDGTADLARAAGARVIVEQRRGYGYACAAGVSAAQGELLAFLDGDGADDPRELSRLLAPIFDSGADMTLGSRLNNNLSRGVMPAHQQFGNRLSAGLINLLYGSHLTDLSPFRVVRKNKLSEINMQEMTYGWPTEMLTKALGSGWNIEEIQVKYRPRLAGKSKISGTLRGTVLATYYIITTILRYSREQKQ